MDPNDESKVFARLATGATTVKKVRWWPALCIVSVAAMAAIWFQWFTEDSQQHRNLNTAKAVVLAFLLLLGWSLFFSRLSWRIRILVLGCLSVIVASLGVMLRLRGVTGDLMPVFEWRWQPHRAAGLALDSGQTPLPIPGTNTTTLPADTNSWPQFLGPNRDATLSGPRLARDWTSRPPRELWRRKVGAGWSGFAVARGLAVTQEQRGPVEMVVCYEAITGRPLWTHEDAARYFTTIAGEGPRATPSIDQDRVYTMGATGILNCLDLRTGRVIWSKQILRENDGQAPGWGISGSPLVVDGRVVVSAGGSKDRSLVAYDALNGQFLWGGGHDRLGYSSPVLFYLGGIRQLLIFNAASLAGHDPGSGRLLWEYRWPSSNPNVAVPVRLSDDRVLISSGYGVGSEAVRLTVGPAGRWEAQRAWKSNRLKAKFTNVVYRDGHIYGLDDGILACLDAATGERRWKEGRYGHGQVILVGDLLIVMTETGEVLLLEPVPQNHRELGRFQAFKGKTWNPPALAGDRLYARTDMEAACFQLPIEK